mgnify:CR=1 FL=1
MISKAKTAKIFVGVDVSQATLDVYRPDTEELLKIENSDEAINPFCSQLEKKKRQVMVVTVAGTYRLHLPIFTWRLPIITLAR